MGPFRRSKRAARPDNGLISCPVCASDCVVPTDWAERDEQRWWLQLRCGECGATREVIVRDAIARRFEADLERGLDQIRAALQRTELEQMAREAEAFAKALELDLVDAADFAG